MPPRQAKPLVQTNEPEEQRMRNEIAELERLGAEQVKYLLDRDLYPTERVVLARAWLKGRQWPR